MESAKSVLVQTQIDLIPILSHLPMVYITHQMRRRECSRKKAPIAERERVDMGWNPGSTSTLLFPLL